jgi:hypothetical protein
MLHVYGDGTYVIYVKDLREVCGAKVLVLLYQQASSFVLVTQVAHLKCAEKQRVVYGAEVVWECIHRNNRQ